ncbi:MAG: TIGR02206 family membrane protein, partial [Verrucomicrobiota bacterium]
LAFLFFGPRSAALTWRQMLPMQMCDWAIVVVIVALLTNHRRWFEVAYFWGIGGTLQALLTPNLQAAFPEFRFLSFFVAHGGIIVAVVYLMLVRRLRPVPASIVRAFLWSEFYFLVTMAVDAWTGVNYGFLLHKPQAKTLLSLLSDDRALYLLQMQLLALVFFLTLYLPFAISDMIKISKAGTQEASL